MIQICISQIPHDNSHFSCVFGHVHMLLGEMLNRVILILNCENFYIFQVLTRCMLHRYVILCIVSLFSSSLRKPNL